MNLCENKNCKGCNRLYWLAKTFSENIWGGIKNVDEVLDYTYIAKKYANEKVFTSFVLYRSEYKDTNMLLQLEEHVQENLIFYVVKFYTTKEATLKDLVDWKMSTLYDKIISMKIYVDNVDVIYSEHYYAPQILDISEELYNYIHNYLEKRKGLTKEQLAEQGEILKNTK